MQLSEARAVLLIILVAAFKHLLPVKPVSIPGSIEKEPSKRSSFKLTKSNYSIHRLYFLIKSSADEVLHVQQRLSITAALHTAPLHR